MLAGAVLAAASLAATACGGASGSGGSGGSGGSAAGTAAAAAGSSAASAVQAGAVSASASPSASRSASPLPSARPAPARPPAAALALYELWNARYAAAGASAGSGATWNLRSNALRPSGWTSADAAGLPVLPGLLSYAQVQAAVAAGKPITHAIRFTADRTQSGFIWPARHAAGSGSGSGLPPMGARFRLAPGFNVAGFCSASTPYCADARAILVEMQHYGLILVDNGSNWYFQGSAFPQWPDGLISLLKGIPARAFQAVSESCLMVSPHSGQATAKPGCLVA